MKPAIPTFLMQITADPLIYAIAMHLHKVTVIAFVDQW